MQFGKLILFLTFIGCQFLSSKAFALQSGDFTYDISDSTVIITRYTGSGGAVVIPNTIDGMPVVGIAFHAFYNKTTLTGIEIPGSVTHIGLAAFQSCSGLTSVTIKNGVTSIGDYAFYGCTGLKSMAIPGSVASIGGYAFYGCIGLTSVTMLEGLTSIGDYAFYGCTGLTGAYFEGNAPLMGTGVFDYCANTFTVYYIAGKAGFTSPFWLGYPSKIFIPACPATKVLGENNPNLEQLRDFRDNSLARSALGRRVIQIYYNNAGSINEALDRSHTLRAVAQKMLETIAPMAGKK